MNETDKLNNVLHLADKTLYYQEVKGIMYP